MSGAYPRHLSFPFRVRADGRTANPAGLAEHVKGEVIQLLLTNQGEREFVPEFGGGVRGLLFEPIDDALVGLSKARITRAISAQGVPPAMRGSCAKTDPCAAA
jgi:phage baseplate assembly protein W